MSNLRFRCLVTDDYHERIEAIALELDARVDYFRAPFGILAVLKEDEYIGCVWVLGKDPGSLREAVLEVLNAD